MGKRYQYFIVLLLLIFISSESYLIQNIPSKVIRNDRIAFSSGSYHASDSFQFYSKSISNINENIMSLNLVPYENSYDAVSTLSNSMLLSIDESNLPESIVVFLLFVGLVLAAMSSNTSTGTVMDKVSHNYSFRWME